jgi:hypothetical protein
MDEKAERKENDKRYNKGIADARKENESQN